MLKPCTGVWSHLCSSTMRGHSSLAGWMDVYDWSATPQTLDLHQTNLQTLISYIRSLEFVLPFSFFVSSIFAAATVFEVEGTIRVSCVCCVYRDTF